MISPETVELLEQAAMQLGTAIKRVRADEAMRRAHHDLELRVQARTEQLASANEVLKEEIAERNRLEREILLVAAKEQQRIGEELHDGLGQELTGSGIPGEELAATAERE